MFALARVRMIALVAVLTLVGCQNTLPDTGASSRATPKAAGPANRVVFDAPDVWGGEARCEGAACRIVLVEHEVGALVLHQVSRRSVTEVDRHTLAYHPDSAKWLTNDWVVAAVEKGGTLDFFKIQNNKLSRATQVNLGFAPRDVALVKRNGDRFTLLAAPYSGEELALVEWSLGATNAKVDKLSWCQVPWHPVVVKRAPGEPEGGVAVACLDDKQVLFVPANNLRSKPKVLATFKASPREVKPTASGQWLYVALETGGANARINMDTGELQQLKFSPSGAVSSVSLNDDTVVWGETNQLVLHRYDAAGNVLEARSLPGSGFPTGLQLIDLDGDGVQDLLNLNSAGKQAEIYYGPLWEQAKRSE